MEYCFDSTSSLSSINIFAYIQKKNGLNKLHVYTTYQGPKEITFNKNQTGEILLEIFAKELDQRFEIIVNGVKYSTIQNPSSIICISEKPIIIEDVVVDIPYMDSPILPPSNLAELPLNEYFLKCLRCENILAESHLEYFVTVIQAEEIMETAMGCCRCCSTSADAHKCGHIRSADTGKIFIDDGVVLVTENYLKNASYIKLGESPLIQCLSCYQKHGFQSNKEYFGFQRYPSKLIEILPMQADFIDEDGNSLVGNLYKCWSAYFASQLISTGLDSYVMITDGFGNPQFQIGFFFRRLLYFGDSNNLKNVTALCFFYTENHTVIQKDLNTKIRLPQAAIEMFKKCLEQSHQLLKPFTPGLGQWKSAFLSLDGGISCLLSNDQKSLEKMSIDK